MSEVTKSEAHKTQSDWQRLRAVQWGALHRALAFVAAAERYATPVHATMAVAAALATIALCMLVSMGFIVAGAPLAVVAPTLVAGAVAKSRQTKPQRRRRKTRR